MRKEEREEREKRERETERDREREGERGRERKRDYSVDLVRISSKVSDVIVHPVERIVLVLFNNYINDNNNYNKDEKMITVMIIINMFYAKNDNNID